jgi:hypothetical protein
MAKQTKPGRPAVTILPDFGKVPPQALDMEEAVLGAIMLEKEAVITILDILKPESFYKDSHKKIFKAIYDLSSREFPVDLYTVTEELRAHNELESVGGPVYLTQLTSKVVSAANVDYHARIVAQKYIQRDSRLLKETSREKFLLSIWLLKKPLRRLKKQGREKTPLSEFHQVLQNLTGLHRAGRNQNSLLLQPGLQWVKLLLHSQWQGTWQSTMGKKLRFSLVKCHPFNLLTG